MGPTCHYQGCRSLAADLPWPGTSAAPEPPVPMCRHHREAYTQIVTSRDRRFRDWVIDVLRDPGGHRQVVVRPTRRRERRALGF
jgi:hypothetical protein